MFITKSKNVFDKDVLERGEAVQVNFLIQDEGHEPMEPLVGLISGCDEDTLFVSTLSETYDFTMEQVENSEIEIYLMSARKVGRAVEQSQYDDRKSTGNGELQ